MIRSACEQRRRKGVKEGPPRNGLLTRVAARSYSDVNVTYCAPIRTRRNRFDD